MTLVDQKLLVYVKEYLNRKSSINDHSYFIIIAGLGEFRQDLLKNLVFLLSPVVAGRPVTDNNLQGALKTPLSKIHMYGSVIIH